MTFLTLFGRADLLAQRLSGNPEVLGDERPAALADLEHPANMSKLDFVERRDRARRFGYPLPEARRAGATSSGGRWSGCNHSSSCSSTARFTTALSSRTLPGQR